VLLTVPLAFLGAALGGALGPAFRLDGTVDHVTLVLIDVDVNEFAAPDGNGSSQAALLPFEWCARAELDGDRLLWFGDSFDTRTSVVVLLRYTSTLHTRWFGSGALAATVLPGQAHAVRPAMMAGPALYRVVAGDLVTLEPGLANRTAPTMFEASYTIHGLDAWDAEGNTNTTVTESHSAVIGYGVPVVQQAGVWCM
jgi:hypothetical protein